MIFFCLFNLLCAGKSDKKIILGTTITYTILLYNRLTNFLFPGNYFQRNQASNQVNIIEKKKCISILLTCLALEEFIELLLFIIL